MNINDCFAKDYADARAKFLAAARDAGAAITSFPNPLRGPALEPLATDLAWLGPADASHVVVTISATHGVEGFCGSGAQVATFRAPAEVGLPKGAALAQIHAINPHGFAWVRRVNEDNVDINRNFVDHTQPYPVNAGYEELADAIVPSEWTQAAQAAAWEKLEAFRKARGPMALQTAISGGQYSHPQGVFFGGHAPTWSNRVISRIFKDHLARADKVHIVDYHTGLGPYGFGELIGALPPKTPEFARTQAIIGNELTSPDLGSSTSAPLVGVNQPALVKLIPRAKCAALALEYGTKPVDDVLDAVRADAWLHAHGEFGTEQARAIKAQMRAAFYGDAEDWRRMIWERALDVTRRMIRGFAI